MCRQSCQNINTYLNQFKESITLESEFYSWRSNNKYDKKRFSILGDSISTLEGYHPEGYKVFYSGDNGVGFKVTERKDTWWDKVIRFFGSEFGVVHCVKQGCLSV